MPFEVYIIGTLTHFVDCEIKAFSARGKLRSYPYSTSTKANNIATVPTVATLGYGSCSKWNYQF